LFTFFTLKDRANVVVAVQNAIVTMEVTQQRQEPKWHTAASIGRPENYSRFSPNTSDEQMMNALALAAEPLEGQKVSCWERHWIEGGIAQHQ
jgi:hypothetical protein